MNVNEGDYLVLTKHSIQHENDPTDLRYGMVPGRAYILQIIKNRTLRVLNPTNNELPFFFVDDIIKVVSKETNPEYFL